MGDYFQIPTITGSDLWARLLSIYNGHFVFEWQVFLGQCLVDLPRWDYMQVPVSAMLVEILKIKSSHKTC